MTVGMEVAPFQASHIREAETAQAGKKEGLAHFGMFRERGVGQSSHFVDGEVGFPGFGPTGAFVGGQLVHGVGGEITFAAGLVQQARKDVEVVPPGALRERSANLFREVSPGMGMVEVLMETHQEGLVDVAEGDVAAFVLHQVVLQSERQVAIGFLAVMGETVDVVQEIGTLLAEALLLQIQRPLDFGQAAQADGVRHLQGTTVAEMVFLAVLGDEVQTQELILPLAFVINVQIKGTVAVLDGFDS